MKKKLLNIPARVDSEPTKIDVRKSALSAWINALPLMDYTRSCEQMMEALHHLNCHHLDVKSRIQAMTLLSNRVDKLHKLIPRNFESDSLPLSEKKLKSKQQAELLLAECAIGHKIIVTDLVADRSILSRHKKALFFSIVKALHYMSLELIERFLIYRDPQEGTWQDIHKLYAISEQMGILDIAISGNAAHGEASTSINELYKKILLLSLADMSRLMTGEAAAVYKKLAEWSMLTSLSHCDDSFREGVVVDLGIDAPANHVFSEKPIKFLNGRVFDLSRLLAHMDKKIDVLGEQGKKGNNMLSARARQAMYIRLRFTWGTRGERGAVREPINKPVKLISGLHDCHRGLSDNAHFNPEHDELRFDPDWNKAGASPSDSAPASLGDSLSLVPEDQAPWLEEALESRMASNFNDKRVSQFNELKTHDAWEKIYSNEATNQARYERDSMPLTVTDCIQVDTSPGGMAVVCEQSQVGASLAVGKVVAISTDDSNDQWQTGVVRWLIMLPNNNIRCGMQILSQSAEVIAVKGLKGVGEDGEYFRAIMIPAEEGCGMSVIVPAAVYSSNTILSVVTQQALKYLVLKELLNNSASYNQFLFEEIDKPMLGINLMAKIDRNRRSF